jgi:glutathione peroxidase
MSLLETPIARLDGSPATLGDITGGGPALLVNVASRCGLTPQYTALEQLHEKYADRGFTVVGVPCNQFGGQEPGDSDQIGAFCQKNYGVTFPMFEKVEVNGDDAHPVYQWLREEKGGLLGSKIKWNFTKFLLGRDGEVIDRFGPTTKPEKLAKDVEKALAS